VRKLRDKKGLLDCPACETLSIRLGGQPCPNCGWEPKRAGEFIATTEGELGLVQGGRAKAHEYSPEARQRWYAMLTGVAAERGYRAGWVAHKYREKFGDWPQHGGVTPIKPSPEVLSWVRSRNIAWAKSNQRAAQ
jgi:DNA repair protein RadD